LDLLEVSRFSQKTFELAAGFLRIPESENPLDNTGVHPERYGVLEGYASKNNLSIKDLLGAGVATLKKAQELKQELGEFTFADLVSELEKPGRDPRETFVPFSFREDLFEVKDLKPEMICPGIVTNVTNFGVFVDVGVHQDGLVHISQLADRFVKDPRTLVSPGDHVKVKVLEVNLEKNQISFSMKGIAGNPGAAEPRAHQPREHRENREHREPRKHQHHHKKPNPQVHSGPTQGGRPMSQQKPMPQRAPKPVFNNAFAGLASLKSTLKSK
jgi:uncharacterized protein